MPGKQGSVYHCVPVGYWLSSSDSEAETAGEIVCRSCMDTFVNTVDRKLFI